MGKPVPVALDQYATDAAAAGKEFVRPLNNDPGLPDHEPVGAEITLTPTQALSRL